MAKDNKQRLPIYVSAYPKSGSTWLTRLLGDVLNSPTGGCMPSEDTKEIATEGQDRPGPYIVRKGHFVLIDNDTGPVVPSAHRLAWKRLTDERLVFLVRDPRDICISGAYHWRCTPAEFLDRMIKGDVARCGRWDEYCDRWFGIVDSSYYLAFGYVFAPVRYEDLSMLHFITLEKLFNNLSLSMPLRNETEAIIQRQSFTNRSKGLPESEMRRNNMRRGVVGDWRNHFTSEMQDKIWHEFGWIMDKLGYQK